MEHGYNSGGQVLKAQFVEADDKMVSADGAIPYTFKLAWASFADESLAKLEALRRKEGGG